MLCYWNFDDKYMYVQTMKLQHTVLYEGILVLVMSNHIYISKPLYDGKYFYVAVLVIES